MLLLGCSPTLYSQTIKRDSVVLGFNYQQEVFYSLRNGVSQVSNQSDWDLSHTTVSRDNCLRLNHAKGWELRQYPHGTVADWGKMDTSNWKQWPLFYNSTEDALLGAFNQTKNKANVWDFSWGVYNPNSHEVVGDSLFLLVFQGQPRYKFWPVVQKINGDLVIRYQAFDGSPAITDTLLQKASPYRYHKYWGAEKGQLNIEPEKWSWDLRFFQYFQPLWDSTNQQTIAYPVVGVQSAPHIRVMPIEGKTWQWAQDSFWAYSGPTQFSLSPIGYDWKFYDGQSSSYKMVPNRSYWIESDSQSALIRFVAFEGRSTGKIAFELMLASQILGVESHSITLPLKGFPNPCSDVFHLPISGHLPLKIRLMNLETGQWVHEQLVEKENLTSPYFTANFAHVPSGRYLLFCQQNEQIYSQLLYKN